MIAQRRSDCDSITPAPVPVLSFVHVLVAVIASLSSSLYCTLHPHPFIQIYELSSWFFKENFNNWFWQLNVRNFHMYDSDFLCFLMFKHWEFLCFLMVNPYKCRKKTLTFLHVFHVHIILTFSKRNLVPKSLCFLTKNPYVFLWKKVSSLWNPYDSSHRHHPHHRCCCSIV